LSFFRSLGLGRNSGADCTTKKAWYCSCQVSYRFINISRGCTAFWIFYWGLTNFIGLNEPRSWFF